MKASDFDYQLPTELIAQKPLAQRRDSRLLLLDPANTSWSDENFSDLPRWIEADDLIVFNDTRVFPARLFGRKQTGGKLEVLVERLIDEQTLWAHVRSSKSPKPGARLILQDAIECEMLRREGEFFVLHQSSEQSWLELLQQHGHIPLPPYIEREDEAADRERYQTVFAQRPGAVAAPTAGLHFDDDMIATLQQQGVESATVTLHVGAGTFQPVRVDRVADHVMHAEQIEVTPTVCDKINAAKARGGRIIAIGTTVVRSLETAAAKGDIQPFKGDSRLFITPGYRFNVVDAMLTNFHLPRSTLLMLVSAFAGHAFTLQAYRHAVEQHYRFFSYGDAMFIKSRVCSA